MKIIFDNEEQKELFFKNIAFAWVRACCPSEIGLKEFKGDCATIRCSDCWKEAIERTTEIKTDTTEETEKWR